MAVVETLIYGGEPRPTTPSGLAETFTSLRAGGGLAWIWLDEPTAEEVAAVARGLGLHELVEEDVAEASQRPKLERYGDTLFTVLRTARYVEDEERVAFGEVHVFTGADYVVAVRHTGSPDLRRVRRRLEGEPELLRLGPDAALYAILDEVVDEYGPVIGGLQQDLDEIEDEIFDSSPTVSRRIYELSREVMAFQRATHPLVDMLEQLELIGGGPGSDEELRHRLRDVRDHTLRVVGHADAFRHLLDNALTVNATLVAQRQNEEMRRITEASYRQNEQVKRISSWAAILFAPTLVATVYGMNFHHMPELSWRLGYPLALVAMVAMGAVLYAVFKRHHWL